jgi:PIN domain nuclease of toxin-antitoxin system
MATDKATADKPSPDKLLLDTHTFLWWVQDAPDLSQRARRAIANAQTSVYLSAASVWEMAIKASLGKLRLAVSVEQFVSTQLAANGFKLIDIGFRHLARVEALPRHHGDPFDRLLIVQAQLEGLTLVSKDTAFKKYDIERLW